MAISFVRSSKIAVGSNYRISGDLTLDGSYGAGGYALTAALFGHRNTLNSVEVAISNTGFLSVYRPSTLKLQFYKVGAAGALTECVAGDLSSAAVVRIHTLGK